MAEIAPIKVASGRRTLTKVRMPIASGATPQRHHGAVSGKGEEGEVTAAANVEPSRSSPGSAAGSSVA